MKTKNTQLAYRLGEILAKLNLGDRLEVAMLAEEFNVTERTIIRDLKERLVFLDWEEQGPKYYSLSKSSLGQLYPEDVDRFAHFASIQNLFPKLDREFFQQKLTQSVCVKGHNYEDISHKKGDFDLIKAAIESQKLLCFSYYKNQSKSHKSYRVAPYILINRSGIWYLMADDQGQIKTFCFSRIEGISVQNEHFTLDQAILEDLKNIDSVYYGNQIKAVTVFVRGEVAIYFKRRKLLPNQSIIEEKSNGDLVVMSEHVSAQEILALVRYWIPNVKILSPEGLQTELEEGLQAYLLSSE
ncbi:helix-turn-helix transcriptional regulator [Wohlfahrtiimonas chitiniclastica]|uniref:helix-turn-helix transcriptional regulator n=1 Tax=Wohlfahrtiimonas chitiniclastica TaxID=400946 RepID=UPI000B981F0A|nr:WYL domain-containing protein [Wohlfahrtiimonas chitiniclastica]MBS7837515.1 WYL domain-containing protein [Wohlfahrtiimonas chitiniclastica]OYQ89674.1 transcriptional regulator [Wohlfahrtiimonas chitiniclastica]